MLRTSLTLRPCLEAKKGFCDLKAYKQTPAPSCFMLLRGHSNKRKALLSQQGVDSLTNGSGRFVFKQSPDAAASYMFHRPYAQYSATAPLVQSFINSVHLTLLSPGSVLIANIEEAFRNFHIRIDVIRSGRRKFRAFQA